VRDLLTISVSTVHETRHFSLKFSTLKVVLYSLLFGALLVIGLISATVWLWRHGVQSEHFFSSQINEIAREFGKKQKHDHDLIEAYQQALSHQGKVMLSNQQDRAGLVDQINQMQEASDAWENAYQSLMDKLDIQDGRSQEITDSVPFKSVKLDSGMKSIMQSIIPSGFPVKDFRWSDGYGWRIHPITHKREFHKGQDMAAPTGTPIYAPADGVVAYSGYVKGYGRFLKIDHGFGFTTRYGHLSKILVKIGQVVTKGTKIATIGNTGVSTGPHLHYEVRYVNRALNPKPFMKWTRHDFASIVTKEKKVPWGSLAEMMRQQVLMARKQLLHAVAKSTATSAAKVASTSTASSKGASGPAKH